MKMSRMKEAVRLPVIAERGIVQVKCVKQHKYSVEDIVQVKCVKQHKDSGRR